MKGALKFLFLAGLAVFTAQARAEVTVTGAWVRGTVPKQTATEVFMTLTSTRDVALVLAASPVAGIVEIQRPVTSGGEKGMRAIDEVELPAGQSVALAPGGLQVMLIELRKPLRAGEKVPITLTFVNRDNQRFVREITAEVRPAGAPARER
jgi:copper(I)-binding protein